ncbi:MAG: magnesium chelatase [Thermoprotei archaeon]|nr:MAG: magnesium chelatase [Thermoprotei archaeon]RLE56760.1 MAG: magnesium chelatase [Thermoprotei archaeon]
MYLSQGSRRIYFPFSAIVGLEKAKLALLAVAVDPTIGGVLLCGDKGTGKTTLVRSLAQILPEVPVVKGCPFNCNPLNPYEMCEEHYQAWLRGEKLEIEYKPMRVIDLPLNVTVDRLVGTIDVERALREGKVVFKPGILAEANRNILYIDEVNLLDDYIADLLLDAAATGWNIVEREGISFRHPARFVLVGSMNPEEGELRPQILDRFGLFVDVSASMNPEERAEIVRRVEEFHRDPLSFIKKFESEERKIRETVARARELIREVHIDNDLLKLVAETMVKLRVRTHRADIVVVKTAKAIATLDGRTRVELEDVKKAMELALPHRIKTTAPQNPRQASELLEKVLNEVLGTKQELSTEHSHKHAAGSSSRVNISDTHVAIGSGISGKDSIIAKLGDLTPTSQGLTSLPTTITKSSTIRELHLTPTTPTKGRTSRECSVTLVAVGRGRVIYHTVPVHDSEYRDIDLVATLRATVSRCLTTKLPIPSQDIRVRVRRVKVPVLNIVVLDASGSMLALNRIQLARELVEKLATRSYVTRSSIAIVVFRGRSASCILPPTRCYAKALELLREIEVGGSTPLFHGLLEAYNVAKLYRLRYPLSRVHIYLVSDGKVNVLLTGDLDQDIRTIATLLEKLQCKLTIFEVRGEYSLNIGMSVIEKLAEMTNGEYRVIYVSK